VSEKTCPNCGHIFCNKRTLQQHSGNPFQTPSMCLRGLKGVSPLSIYKYTSPYFNDMDAAEQIVFALLKKYRIKNRREFFRCDLEIIKSNMKKVELILSERNESNSTINNEDKIVLVQPLTINIGNQSNYQLIEDSNQKHQIQQVPINIGSQSNDQSIENSNQKHQIQQVPINIGSQSNDQSIENSNQKHQCPFCKQCFSRQQRLESHLKRKTSCQESNNNQKSKITLKYKDLKSSPIICQYCKKTFTRNDNLIRHQRNFCIKLQEPSSPEDTDMNVNSQSATVIQYLKENTEKMAALEKQLTEMREQQDIEKMKYQTEKQKIDQQIAELKEKLPIKL
jgi:hypothetical protein